MLPIFLSPLSGHAYEGKGEKSALWHPLAATKLLDPSLKTAILHNLTSL